VICATGAACLAAWMIPRMAAQCILAIGCHSRDHPRRETGCARGTDHEWGPAHGKLQGRPGLALVSPAICRGLDPIRDLCHGRSLSRGVDDPANDIKIVTVPIARMHCAAIRGIIHAARQAAPVAQITNGDRANSSILLAPNLSFRSPLLILPGLCVHGRPNYCQSMVDANPSPRLFPYRFSVPMTDAAIPC
jgi:hypothetical protein